MRLTKDNSHFIEGKKGFDDGPQHVVSGASVKITRASSGSMGKITHTDLIDYKPDEEVINWANNVGRDLDDELSEMRDLAHHFVYDMLKEEPIEILPELMVSDNKLLRETAKRLIDEYKQETSNAAVS